MDKGWRDSGKISNWDLTGRLIVGDILLCIGCIVVVIALFITMNGNGENFVESLIYVLVAFIFLIVGLVFLRRDCSSKGIFLEHLYDIIPLNATKENGDTVKIGTAIFIKQNILVTNAHLIYDKESEKVFDKITCFLFSKANAHTAEREVVVLKYDNNLDIAILYVLPDLKNDKDLKFGSVIKKGKSSKLNVGDKIYAIGNSAGNGIAVSQGTVSLPLVKERLNEKEEYFIQLTVAIIGGNSGGAVLNKKGKLVGMTTFCKTDNPNFAYAIPIEEIMDFIKK